MVSLSSAGHPGVISIATPAPDRASALMEVRDRGLFAERLLDLAQSVAGVDELFACRIVDDTQQTLASGSDLGDAPDRAHAYASCFHRSDPAQDARRAARPNSAFASRIPAGAIVLSPSCCRAIASCALTRRALPKRSALTGSSTPIV